MLSKFLEKKNHLFNEFCFIKIDTETVDFNILKDLLTVIDRFTIKPLIEFEINYKTIDIDDYEAQKILDSFMKFDYRKTNLNECYGDGILIPNKILI